MNQKDFENSPAGRVLKAGQGNAAFWAFIPNPLPPKLTSDWELTRLLSEADRTLSELGGLGRTLPNPSLLVSPFLRREAVLSSRIEGTKSDITDLYYYEAGQLTLPGMEKSADHEADVREVYNYVRALEYGLKRLSKLPASLRLLREIHARLLEGVRGRHATPGEFRTRQNWIGGATINEAVYVPPPVPEMETALAAFENYLHALEDVYPPLIRLAFIHYQFEAIHPFVDGNGRIGRLLLSLLLVNWNILPLPLLYLSAYFESHRQAYYDGLLAISQRGAWREWVTFFLKGVVHQSQDGVTRAKRLQDLQSKWRTRLLKERVTGLALGLVDMLLEMPVLSAEDIRTRFNVSHPAAMNALRRFADLGFLREVTGKERYRRYVADAIFEILL
jgi:Fic family protein